MGERNWSHSNHFMDLGADQQSQAYIYPEPCMMYGSFTAYPHPNVHGIVPAPGNFYVPHLPGHQEGGLFYGMPPANGIQQWHHLNNVGAAFAPPSNYFYPYAAAPVSGTQGSVGNNADNLGPSTSAAPGVTAADESASSSNDSALQDHEGSESAPLPENVSSSASTDLAVPVNHRLQDGLPGNYVGQAYEFPSNAWVSIPSTSNGTAAQSWAWSQAAALPYTPGGAGGYVLAAGNMGMHGYQVASSSGGVTSFMYPQGQPQYHAHLPPNMQSMVGHTMSSPPQMTASPSRQLQLSSSNMGPMLPSGFRMFRPHQREFMPGTSTSHHNGVPTLGFPGYRRVGIVIDQHRDMRLDVDRMSYEVRANELLALGERIGNANTGLTDEFIATNLRTRIFLSTETPGSVESEEQKTFCVICQNDYTNHEKIGILDCEHEYHEECVKKWLVVKNCCAICKAVALSTERKDKEVVVNTGGD